MLKPATPRCLRVFREIGHAPWTGLEDTSCTVLVNKADAPAILGEHALGYRILLGSKDSKVYPRIGIPKPGRAVERARQNPRGIRAERTLYDGSHVAD